MFSSCFSLIDDTAQYSTLEEIFNIKAFGQAVTLGVRVSSYNRGV